MAEIVLRIDVAPAASYYLDVAVNMPVRRNVRNSVLELNIDEATNSLERDYASRDVNWKDRSEALGGATRSILDCETVDGFEGGGSDERLSPECFPASYS